MTQKKDILLEAPCPELLCGLCTDILNDPMQVHCSEDHMFCRSCLANYNKDSCPSCLEPLDKTSFQLSKFVKRQISRLRARCPYHSLGCPWEGLLEDCHSQSCEYQSIHCPNSHRGCPELINFMDMDQHRTQCLYELIACPNASKDCQPYLRKDSANHDSTCSSFRCLFAQEGCPFVGTLQAVGRHCEEYCGKLHERIRQLEVQCNYMKQQLEQQQPDTENIVETIMNDTKAATTQDAFMDSSTDSSMDEMALFHQMFNNNYLSVPTPDSKGKYTHSATMNEPTPSILDNTKIQQAQPLEYDTGLSSDTVQPHTPSPPPPSVASAPKRSTNGKIIRYSKNKQLAHGALRMSRQRSTSGSSLTTEAILHALHMANKSNQDEDINMASSTPSVTMSTSSPTSSTTATTQPIDTSRRRQSSSTTSNYSFKSLDDVTKFLEELPPIVEDSPFLSPAHTPRKYGTTKQKGNSNSDRVGKPKSTSAGSNKRQQKAASTVSSTENSKNDGATPTTPNRPMYVLASTLLSKHTQGH